MSNRDLVNEYDEHRAQSNEATADAIDTVHQTKTITKYTFVMVMMIIGAAIGLSGFHQNTNPSLKSAASLSSADVVTPPLNPETIYNKQSNKPNFVFFMADDLPWNSIGYNNFDFAKVTPHLNEFASNGIVVENYYAQEICTPSRTSLFTGRYPSTIGQQFGEIMLDQIHGLNLKETLFPEVMKHQGDYKNYIVGKWNMGNSDARYLPTRRGFDDFFGYLGGGINPYTKGPVGFDYVDFMYSDDECYNVYDGDDFDKYSTYLFRNKALDAVNTHDFEAAPMFLYVAFHGVHTPLGYDGLKINGEDIGEDLYELIQKEIPSSTKRQLIADVLALMDQSIKKIYDAIKERGQEDNTYFIFASDNGGCNDSGGFNGPLRGDKGSLFEGGVRVDAMIWGNILPHAVRNTRYNGLMHTSDWFPTILELAGIDDFEPEKGYELDGISQAAAMLDGRSTDFPRTKMLYNVYINMDGSNFDLNSYTQAAVRNEQYKLIYAFVDNDVTKWYNYKGDDTDITGDCDPQTAMTGTDFKMMLFDIKNDPYEQNDLYGNADLKSVQDELTAELEYYAKAAAPMPPGTLLADSPTWFAEHGGFVQPWLVPPSEDDNWPIKCSKETVFRVSRK